MAAVTYVERLSESKTIGFPSGDPAITSSFTPAAGEQLLLIVAGEEKLAHNQDFTGSWTISDTQGLTWTPIDSVANTTSDAIGMRAWLSSPAAASSVTVTIDCSFYFFFSNEIKVLGLTGLSGTIAGYVEDAAAATDGGYTRTLTTAPTVDDLTIFARYLKADQDTALDMETGWTELASVPSLLGAPLGVATRTGSTSTSVVVDDTQVTSVPNAARAIDFAFIVRASTGAAVSLSGNGSAATALSGALDRDRGLAAVVAAATGFSGSVGRDRAVDGSMAVSSFAVGSLTTVHSSGGTRIVIRVLRPIVSAHVRALRPTAA